MIRDGYSLGNCGQWSTYVAYEHTWHNTTFNIIHIIRNKVLHSQGHPELLPTVISLKSELP